MEVVVHFNTQRDGKGRDLRAIAGPDVRAIFMFPDVATQRAFAANSRFNGKKPELVEKKIPPEVTLKLADTDETTELEDDEHGPDVCYLVRDTMVCWNSE